LRKFPRADRAIAAVIADERKRQGLSARQLAVLMDRPHNYVARIESLQRLPTGGELIHIAKLLGLRASTLLARVERRLK
jgi:transcriptional regulator with XRE-family HTH domain